MGDEERNPESILARVAREDLASLGPVDYGSAFAAPARVRARTSGRRRIGAPLGIAAALALGIGLGAGGGIPLWRVLAGAIPASRPASAAGAAAVAAEFASLGEASLGEEMELFLDELLADDSADLYALIVDVE